MAGARKHAKVIQEVLDKEVKADKLWQDYQEELFRLDCQTHLLHYNTMGMYGGNLSQRIDFLTKQKGELSILRQANAEFIRYTLQIQREKIEEQL